MVVNFLPLKCIFRLKDRKGFFFFFILIDHGVLVKGHSSEAVLTS